MVRRNRKGKRGEEEKVWESKSMASLTQLSWYRFLVQRKHSEKTCVKSKESHGGEGKVEATHLAVSLPQTPSMINTEKGAAGDSTPHTLNREALLPQQQREAREMWWLAYLANLRPKLGIPEKNNKETRQETKSKPSHKQAVAAIAFPRYCDNSQAQMSEII